MATILRLSKCLVEPPPTVSVAPELGRLRRFGQPDDVTLWLEIRQQAFAELTGEARRWTPADFRREFVGKPWWAPGRIWLAEQARGESHAAVGAIGVGEATSPDGTVAATLVWLAVVPQARRQGWGQRLVGQAEATAWQLGYRRVTLETLPRWRAAVQLYRRCGYC